MILSYEERAKFAAYLEESAHDGEMMAEQMEKIGDKVTGLLVKRLRTESAAERIVAAKLRSIESVSIPR
jgi:hypothetical protein